MVSFTGDDYISRTATTVDGQYTMSCVYIDKMGNLHFIFFSDIVVGCMKSMQWEITCDVAPEPTGVKERKKEDSLSFPVSSAVSASNL